MTRVPHADGDDDDDDDGDDADEYGHENLANNLNKQQISKCIRSPTHVALSRKDVDLHVYGDAACRW